MQNYFKDGSWNCVCDSCGFQFKAEELRKRWDGLMVCKDDWEMDHPQKYLRVRETGQAVPFIRNEPPDSFVNVCTPVTSSPRAEWGTAGCAMVGRAGIFGHITYCLMGTDALPNANFADCIIAGDL